MHSNRALLSAAHSLLEITAFKGEEGLEHYSFNFSQSILLVWYLSALKEENLFKPMTYY